MKSKEVFGKLYATYGTDSGILFGIADKTVVSAIVDFTAGWYDSENIAIASERDEYRKALEQIAEHDGEILFPGNGFFSSVSVASESLAKYPQR